jgi:arylsulfatase A-like enzyme
LTPLLQALALGISLCVAAPALAKMAKPVNAPSAASPLKYKDYNIVLVSFDAMQAQHVHALGYPKAITPTIDAMAREGFNFTQDISVASWTVPASMTWFTGVYPSEHRLLNKFTLYAPPVEKIANMKELAPSLVTLAEVLKGNGYATAGFTGDAGVNGVFGYKQGFDVYFDEAKFGDLEQSVPRALTWLKEKKDHKFFLFLHGYDSHGQSIPQGGLDRRFVDPAYKGKYTGSKAEQEALREEGLAKGAINMSPEDVAFWRAIYDEKINRADGRFQKFMEGMQALGLKDNTLFVLTADHGTEVYEHKRFDHGFSLFDELIHVPLIIKLPEHRLGGTIPGQVSSVDVMPTILDLLDVSVPDQVQKQLRGQSLVANMRGETVPARDCFSETDYRLYTFKRSIRTPEGWKFIMTMETKAKELYNLKDDPNETKNLMAKEPRVAYELEQKLFAHFKAIGHDLTQEKWKTGLSPVYPSQAKGWKKK